MPRRPIGWRATKAVRAFAAEQGANPLTVAKAYQSFQDDGLVEVRRGVGMFVLPGAVEKLRVAERERFTRRARQGTYARRVSLGLKQTQRNPWEVFAETHPAGTQIEGEVKNITEFGLFIGL
mgnify:CR=1 FL=1